MFRIGDKGGVNEGKFMRLLTVALACSALAVLAGCNRKSETEKAPPPVAAAPVAPATPTAPDLKLAQGFRHQDKFDASGYYLTPEPLLIGNYRMTHMGVGAPSDFSQWEEGKRASVFGPILFQFEDVTSPTQTNEMGGEAHTVSVRVLPKAYSFSPGEVTFVGSDPKLGEVVFSGAFDEPALTRARNEGSSQAPVLRGVLKVGNAAPRQVALIYFVGE